MSLTTAKDRMLKSIGIAQETELQLYERLRDVGRDVVLLKEEIANAGFNIKAWIERNTAAQLRMVAEPRAAVCGVGQVPDLLGSGPMR